MENNNADLTWAAICFTAVLILFLFAWLMDNARLNQYANHYERPSTSTIRRSWEPEHIHNTSSSSNQSYFTSSSYRSDNIIYSECRKGIELYKIPKTAQITNLNSLLHDIFVRYVALKADDFEMHYKIFDKIIQKLHQTMKDVDPYYRKYSSTVQFAGSHYDRLRINKPDEFDMDIIIGLPLNIRHDPYNVDESDIILEPKAAGFLQLKMGVQFLKLPWRDDWATNKTAFEWKDSNGYLLRSKFLSWFKGVVIRALNRFEMDYQSRPTFVVDGITYVIKTSESGPAMTLIIENRSRGFHLDVDLVPALKFPEDRWPIGNSYREIPYDCRKGVWMVVGKPDMASYDPVGLSRSWRIALHNQERELMHDSKNLRQAMRFLKKLRDAQGMLEIASYYIKTLFYWEIVERNDEQYWSRNNPATILKMMVIKFHNAMVRGYIPYFWNKENNLIGKVSRCKLNSYANTLAGFIKVLEEVSLYEETFKNRVPLFYYRAVAKYLLTPKEYVEYEELMD